MAPPRQPPLHLVEAYTLNGTVPLEDFFVDDSGEGAGTFYSYDASAIEEELAQAKSLYRSAQPVPSHLPPLGSSRFAKTQWLVRALAAMSLTASRVVVFGSIDPFEECLCLAAGAAHVTTVDYNRLSFEHPSLSTMTLDELSGSPPGSLQFDVALSLSSFDHDGLGRYGDRLHPMGDLLAMRTAWRVLRPGGRLLLSVPVGPDVLVWNLHRRYGPKRLPWLLRGWEEVTRFGWEESRLNEPASYLHSYEPLFLLRRNGTTSDDIWDSVPAVPPLPVVPDATVESEHHCAHDEV
ncbi:hypothetical protein AB1Y20_019352 [Prymnesium parvum]|uniref:Methyltransferase type 11 domain-containing protein n=1 Tax=Prymnesium parvum TaxID=97485 RepID=A0AB34JTS5_PRYPA